MIESYKCVYLGGEGEIVEKKSRFIATVEAVESEEEAIAFIEKMKKKILGCQTQLLRLCDWSKGRIGTMQ